MIGGKARLRKVQFQGPEDPRLVELSQMGMGHGIPSPTEHWFVEDLATPNALPSNIAFGGANGGEYRKTFHGYAPGYVQVIESPEQIQITPMQVAASSSQLLRSADCCCRSTPGIGTT